jgi:3-oxoacyl-[acyl-carrier-protein] synthase-1
MAKALEQAGLKANQVDYLNLHGTGTILNDAMESRAVDTLFSNNVAVSSSKGMTGHTLGAAAALELGFCCLLLSGNESDRNVIPNINNDDIDKSLPELNWVKLGQRLNKTINVCQSNSFAFGGSNVSIVVTRV